MFRKTMLFAAVTVLMVPAMASAQNESVTATATVATTSQVTGAGDLVFDLTGTGDATVDPTGATAATRTVTYNYDMQVVFDDVPAALSFNGVNLPVTLMCATQLGGTWSTAQNCDGAVLPLDVGTSTTTATIGFGGTILRTDIDTVPAGTYTGTFTIRVEAQS